jgi:hypothetical protein
VDHVGVFAGGEPVKPARDRYRTAYNVLITALSIGMAIAITVKGRECAQLGGVLVAAINLPPLVCVAALPEARP